MLPALWVNKSVELSIDGTGSSYLEVEFSGRKYAMFSIPHGHKSAHVEATYNS
jgi:hypothetical protein